MSLNKGVVSKSTSKQQSVDGNVLCLEISHHETPNLCFEFTVKKVPVHFTDKEILFSIIIVLSFLTTINFQDPNFYFLCFVFLTVGRLILKLLWNIKSESVLVIAPVGLQLTVTYQCGIQNSQLIPWHYITDVIINEAITAQKVVYYLAVLVEDPVSPKNLIPLFQLRKQAVLVKASTTLTSFNNFTSTNFENEFWSRHSKMFALLQLKKKFEHFELFSKVFILKISMKEANTGVEKSDTSYTNDCSEVWPGDNILSNLHRCNAMTDSPKSPALRRSLSTSSLPTLDPSKSEDTLSALGTPPEKVADTHVNCPSYKQCSTTVYQQKRKYSYGTWWQPPSKRTMLRSEDFWPGEMEFNKPEKKSKSFSSLLIDGEERYRFHYLSDQTQSCCTCSQGNVLKDCTNTLKALINKCERDVSFKFRDENDLQVRKTTDESKIENCNSCADNIFTCSCSNDVCKNVTLPQDTCRSDDEHCQNIYDIPCTSKETFEAEGVIPSGSDDDMNLNEDFGPVVDESEKTACGIDTEDQILTVKNGNAREEDNDSISSLVMDCVSAETSWESKMINDDAGNEVLNSDMYKELCISSTMKNFEHFPEESLKMIGAVRKTEMVNSDLNYNPSTYVVSNMDTSTNKRARQSLRTIKKEVMYPRPLDYSHVLTRRQFENEVKLFEDKVLTVDELMSSNVRKRELRTRSMKGKTVNLTKLLQDLDRIPIVVLCRIDVKCKKHVIK